jgi:hypothetical protein
MTTGVTTGLTGWDKDKDVKAEVLQFEILFIPFILSKMLGVNR